MEFKPQDELEKLFLLEFLVDNVQLDTNRTRANEDKSEVLGTCAVFHFLNYPPLEICEKDFADQDDDDNTNRIQFKTGKSCLFSLTNCAPQIKCFKIKVEVVQKKKTGEDTLVGKCYISLGEGFLRVINVGRQEDICESLTESTKDKYTLKNEKGEEVGNITLFVRFSCFGKMILSQFQITDEEKNTFFFKRDDKKKLGEVCPDLEENGRGERCEAKCLPCRDSDRESWRGGGMERTQDGPPRYPYMHNRTMGPGLLGGAQEAVTTMPGCTCGGALPLGGAMYQRPLLPSPPVFPPGMTAQPYPPVAPPSYGMAMGPFGAPPGLSPNMMAGIPGNLNPPYCGKFGEKDDSSSSDEEPEHTQLPRINLCECDYPLPPGFMQTQKPEKKKKKKNKKKKDKGCPFEFGSPMGYALACMLANQGQKQCNQYQMEPESMALMEDRVVLQMPGQFQAGQQFPNAPYFPQPTQGYDYPPSPYDMYSLKVGRMVNGPVQNPKVEVAFQKSTDPSKRICRHHAETQYAEEDFGGATVKKGGKKGDKGGKKKDKKGKGKKK